MDCAWLGKLIEMRWDDAQRAFGYRLPQQLTWDIGKWPHFEEDRGYAVTLLQSGKAPHMRFAEKSLKATSTRVDGVLRHEIGHVVDHLIEPVKLNWFASRKWGLRLPDTDERRADLIAEGIWGTPIYYDTDLFVQTTSPNGSTFPRPEWLGL